MLPDLWRCSACGRTFANRNQSHFCGSITSVDAHFAKRPPEIRTLFDAFVDAVRECGPVEILAEKTRIAFHVRMSFAVIIPRRDHLAGHFIFATRVESPRFTKIETYSPQNHLHAFRIARVGDIDAEFRRWIRDAYAIGEQKHLRTVT
jgi:Domain of unknown function (DUF5655)